MKTSNSVIEMLQVQQKLKTDTYEDVDELSADIELLVNNAKAFYKSDSMEYKDAVNLWNLFLQTKQSLENSTSMSYSYSCIYVFVPNFYK